MTGTKTGKNLVKDFAYEEDMISGEEIDQEEEIDKNEKDEKKTPDKSNSDETVEIEDHSDEDKNGEALDEEAGLASGLFEGFNEFLGEKPEEGVEIKNLDDFYAYVGKVLDEKQKPHYTSSLAKEIDEAVAKGMSEEEFLSARFGSYEPIDISTEEGQEKTVREYLAAQGWKEDEIEDELDDLKDSGRLEKRSKTYAKKLDEARSSQSEGYFAERQRQLDEMAEKQRGESEAFIESLKTIKEIDGRKISEKEAKDFSDWVHRPSVMVKDQNGKYTQVSPYQRRLQDPEFVKRMLYYAYKGFSLDEGEKKISAETRKKIFGNLQRESADSKKGVEKSTRKTSIAEDFGYGR